MQMENSKKDIEKINRRATLLKRRTGSSPKAAAANTE